MRFTCRNNHDWSSLRFRAEAWERICPTCQLPAESSLKRTPLNRVSEKREKQVRKQGGTLKKGRGFAVTSPQRLKVRGKVCVGCGDPFDFENEQAQCDPAHLWPRGLGGCDSPDCIVPLCRTCHRRLDDPSDSFDLLPQLVDRGYHREIAHAIEVHEVPLALLLERLTGDRYVVESPEREVAA